MQRQSLFGAAFEFFLPVTRRFFPESRPVSGWNGGLSRRVIPWKLRQPMAECKRWREMIFQNMQNMKDKLKLPINREKTLKYWDTDSYPLTAKERKANTNWLQAKRAGNHFKEKLKIITRKTTPMSFDERIQKLKEVT